MSYIIREPDRAALLTWLETHLNGGEHVDSLSFDRRTGRAQQQLGQMDAEVLAQLEAEDVIRECLERWCTSAGRWQFRITFQERDEDGARVGKERNLRRAIEVRREAAGAAGSQGQPAAFEALAGSYGGAFDRLSAQLTAAGGRSDELINRVLDFQHDYNEVRLEESGDYQQQIGQLSIDLARAEQTIVMLESQSAGVPAEVWAQLIPGGVAVLQALAGRLTLNQPQAPAAPAAPLQGAPVAAE